jgi:heat shock protein HtpX
MSNTLKTTLLLGALTGIIVWIGQLMGGHQGMIIALIFAGVMNFGSYWFSDTIVLKMYRGREVSMNEAPQLYQIVHNLTTRAGLPMPKLYVIPSEGANAFATGRNPHHAAVAVTQGILRILSPEELEGVLAHELSHVRNRDILISSIAATLAGVIMIVADMARWAAIFGGFSRDERDDGGGVIGLLVTVILAPLAAMLIQFAISRSREFQADASAAQLLHTGDPLARALEKLNMAAERIPMDASPQTAHMFIVNPLSGRSFASLFSTHPPAEERIARLRNMRF